MMILWLVTRCLMLKILLTLLTLTGYVQKVSCEHMRAEVELVSGQYSVYFGTQLWLVNASTYLNHAGQHYSTNDSSLTFIKAEKHNGTDKLGRWTGTTIDYITHETKQNSDNKLQAVQWQATIKQYVNRPIIMFSQHFPDGVPPPNSGNPNGVISSFPAFQIDSSSGGAATRLGLLQYAGLFMGYQKNRIQRWQADMPALTSGIESGPIVLFDAHDRAVVISPFSHVMAASMVHENGSDGSSVVRWGIMGSVTDIPVGYTYHTIMYSSDKGIRQAMHGWGETMRYYYNKDLSIRDNDPTIKYIGYYTDRGTYYYEKPAEGQNFEDTMLNVVKYNQLLGIPFKYIQYDDWWYQITHHGYGATLAWEPIPQVFPHGLQYLLNQTKLPVVAHNRYWSNDTVYARPYGPFTFVRSGLKALPTEQGFWEFLFARAVQWGLIVYEQDFMNEHSLYITQLQQYITLGEQWLQQMNNAAEQFAITIQYCMSLPRHALYSVMASRVTQIRASEDNLLTPGQWQIGITSMFADALGLAPFKDNFWSTKSQPGNPYNLSEPCTLLEATASILSTGPVAPGDGEGHTNKQLLDRLYAASGLLLKPSKPAMAINSQILQAAFGGDIGPQGELWTTYTDIAGLRFGIIFCGQLSVPYKLKLTEIASNMSNNSYYYTSWFTPQRRKSHGRSKSLRKEDTLYYRGSRYGTYTLPHSSTTDPPLPYPREGLLIANCTNTLPCLLYTAPLINVLGNEIVILGETEKFVPISPQRITDIDISDDNVLITLHGTRDERVMIDVAIDSTVYTVDCTIPDTQYTVMSALHLTCGV